MVDFPEDDFWRTLVRNLYDGPPDFEALARRSDTYRQADEFARGEVLVQEVERLQSVNHEVTAYAVDAAKDRTPLVFTLTVPPSDPSPSTQPQATPASRSSAAPPPFGTMSYGN